MNLERLLFRKIELWAVGLILLLALFGAIALAAIVYDTENGEKRFGRVGDAAVLVAKAPWTLEEILSEDYRTLSYVPKRFEGSGGWQVDTEKYPTGDIPGYILLSRFDGDRDRHVIELYDLSDLSLKHQWWPDAERLLADARRDWSYMDYTAWRNEAWRAIHPLLLENGDLIIKDHYSPMFRITGCAEPVWMKEDVRYHHSMESDGEGAFWVPTLAEPSDLPGTNRWFYEDTLTRMTPEGEVLFRRSLAKVFIEKGLYHRLFAVDLYRNDPLHLNDIQPALTDGPYWKKGDLFLSIRRYSAIVIYRPSIDKIVWFKEGPWLSQHDVDIVNDHTIAVFNNNVINTGKGHKVPDVSEVMFYDFKTDKTTSPFRKALEKHAVRTPFEGLFDILPTGHLMLEEETAGRLLLFAPNGELIASFINNNAEAVGHRMGWSRYIPEELGTRAEEALQALACRPER